MQIIQTHTTFHIIECMSCSIRKKTFLWSLNLFIIRNIRTHSSFEFWHLRADYRNHVLIMIFTYIPYKYIQSLKCSLGLLNAVYLSFYLLYCDLFVKLLSRRWSSVILFHNCMLLFVINIHWLVLDGWFLNVAHTEPVFISNEDSNRGSLDVVNL